jgi:hypothetical protein
VAFNSGLLISTLQSFYATKPVGATLDANSINTNTNNNELEESTNHVVPGQGNIAVIDFFGAESAHKDVGFVILCEFAGVGCSKLLPLNNAPRDDKSSDLLHLQLYKLLRHYALGQNMRLCYNNMVIPDKTKSGIKFSQNQQWSEEAQSVERAIIASISSSNPDVNFPMTSFNLDLFQALSADMDAKSRNRFHLFFVYGNSSASVEAINNMKGSFVDDDAFTNTKKWRTWLDEQLQREVTAGRLCAGTLVV